MSELKTFNRVYYICTILFSTDFEVGLGLIVGSVHRSITQLKRKAEYTCTDRDLNEVNKAIAQKANSESSKF